MKKYKIMTAAAAVALLLTGCGEQSGTITTITVSETETISETEAISETEMTSVSETSHTEETAPETSETDTSASEEDMEKTISELFERNIICSVYAFGSADLAWGGEPVSGDNIYKVTDDRFSSYSDLESLVRNTYCKATADMLLYDFPYEGTQLYVDVDGMLCINADYAGGKGYYVDWTDTKIIIDSLTADRCEFTAVGSITEPADEPIAEEYRVSGAAVYEDGKWLLEYLMS